MTIIKCPSVGGSKPGLSNIFCMKSAAPKKSCVPIFTPMRLTLLIAGVEVTTATGIPPPAVAVAVGIGVPDVAVALGVEFNVALAVGVEFRVAVAVWVGAGPEQVGPVVLAIHAPA